MPSSKGKSRIITGVIFCSSLALLVLLIPALFQRFSAQSFCRSSLQKLEEEISQKTGNPIYQDVPEKSMPELKVDRQKCAGILEIPCLDRAVPVRLQSSEKDRKLSPYIYEGSIYLRDAVITGTDYPFEFGDLDRLNLKDRVLFTDVDGNVFEYTIQRFFYFTNEQESLLQEEVEKADLILVFPLSRPDQYSGAVCRLVNETDISQLHNEDAE